MMCFVHMPTQVAIVRTCGRCNCPQGGDTTEKAERAMMEDVHDAVFDLVQLIKTYQSKNTLAQVITSTLFRKRQDEMGAVVDRAILGLQVSGIKSFANARLSNR